MKRFRWHFMSATLILVMAFSVWTAAGQAGNTLLRFVHVIPGAAAVDIYVGGQLAVRQLNYGNATAYLSAPAGEQAITVTQAGVTTPLFQQTITAAADDAITLVAASTDPLAFDVYIDNLRPLPLGRARITAIHAIAGAESVDLVLGDGRIVIPSLQFGQAFGTIDIPADAYEFAVTPAGETADSALIPLTPFSLNSSTSYMLVVYGTPTAPAILTLTVPTRPEIASGYVRLVHGIPNAPAVDVLVGDQIVAPALSEGKATDYLALPTGSFPLVVRAGEAELLSGMLDVARDTYVTAVVTGTVDAPELRLVTDDLSVIDAATSVVSVINALSDGEATVILDDELTVIAGVAPGETGTGTIAAEDAILAVNVEQADATTGAIFAPEGGLPGGSIYTILVTEGQPPLVIILPPLGIASSLASAPGSVTIAAAPTQAPVAATPTETAAAAQATQSVMVVTATPTTDAAAQPTQSVIVVTATPTQDMRSEVVVASPTPPVVIAPTIAPTPSFIARVVVNPGANLQLRLYPSREAFSLGLAPANTALRILGREGEAAPIPGSTPTPTFDPANPPLTPTVTPFIDPVALLGEGEDLDAALTWLYVVYDTPDGGTITAWVNALYLDVLNPQGRREPLRNLPTIPRNRPGNASNTSVQPPSAAQNLITVVVGNLSAGVNVHIRRTPDEAGESLALVGSATALEVLGINQAQDWVFVRFADATGGGVRGWVSTAFVSFALNGAPTDIETLEARALLTTTSDDERGSTFAGGIAAPAQPTVSAIRDAIVGEVILNPGANLHLRRRPNVTSESLSLVPAGTQLVVTGQTESGEWFAVTFEGIDGWVSSTYLYLTRNGRAFDPLEVPLILNTPTPTGTLSPEEAALITPTAAP
jgi:uncharacterized protein YgiM (DUF1202 family)